MTTTVVLRLSVEADLMLDRIVMAVENGKPGGHTVELDLQQASDLARTLLQACVRLNMSRLSEESTGPFSSTY
jgi:hypothetical protein